MAPPHISGGGKGKEFLRTGDSEAEEDVESSDQAAASGQAVSEQAQRLEQAGEYKHVNTLLHDLHAEQRHRMLFSTSSPPSSNPVFHHFTVYPEPGHPFPSQTSKSDLPEFTLYPSNSPLPSKHMASFTINIPSKAQETMDDAETECVTHRYEDTNRYAHSGKCCGLVQY